MSRKCLEERALLRAVAELLPHARQLRRACERPVEVHVDPYSLSPNPSPNPNPNPNPRPSPNPSRSRSRSPNPNPIHLPALYPPYLPRAQVHILEGAGHWVQQARRAAVTPVPGP